MNATATGLDGLIEITPTIFEDERGFFKEVIHPKKLANHGINHRFVQVNHSQSKQGVLRGLHYQSPPFAQSKLVRCLRGCILDVAVDIRPNSPTFGLYHVTELSESNHKMLYVPIGFAHGFLALSDCDIEYACGDMYAPQYEYGICWNDPDIGIPWPNHGVGPLVSDKDTQLPTLAQIKNVLFW
ncbi:MAG: dTDP-4-dehydrorhamnose 3,5-epimerase [Candidatus Margulisbacteria bacterium]|nr:dTDP-4-dehydrorhamnose 3,5-epimerase [Candidatus Margulisiibacteriota bacterium]